MIKKYQRGSFVSVDVSRRIRKEKNHKIDSPVDWACFEKEPCKVCKRSMKDAAGRPAYNLLVIFKMMLLQPWAVSLIWAMKTYLPILFVGYEWKTWRPTMAH
jgi:hypothetical protein